MFSKFFKKSDPKAVEPKASEQESPAVEIAPVTETASPVANPVPAAADQEPAKKPGFCAY
jgi:hypothetical protein